jgi:hypothetical protein
MTAAKHTPRPTSTPTGPWHAVGYLNRLGTPFWNVRRDLFIGREYLTIPSGKHRRFMTEAKAKRAAAILNAKATGSN